MRAPRAARNWDQSVTPLSPSCAASVASRSMAIHTYNARCIRGDLAMDHNRLRWAARRGMLELDLLLTSFVERGYGQAEPEDQDLFAWWMGRAGPPDADLKAIVALVLDVCRTAP